MYWSRTGDICHLSHVRNKSDSHFVTFHSRTWDEQLAKSTKKGGQPSLLRAFMRAFGTRYFVFVGIFCVDAWIIRLAQPYCLKLFILSFNEDSGTSKGMQCLIALGVCITSLLHILLNHPTAFQMCISGMKCRVAVSSLIYRKVCIYLCKKYRHNIKQHWEQTKKSH